MMNRTRLCVAANTNETGAPEKQNIMLGMGFGEIMLVAVVLLIVVGPKRLPTLMRAIGKGMRTFRRSMFELRQASGIDRLMQDDVYRPPPRRALPVEGSEDTEGTSSAGPGEAEHSAASDAPFLGTGEGDGTGTGEGIGEGAEARGIDAHADPERPKGHGGHDNLSDVGSHGNAAKPSEQSGTGRPAAAHRLQTQVPQTQVPQTQVPQTQVPQTQSAHVGTGTSTNGDKGADAIHRDAHAVGARRGS